jgi:predicted dehydrogenase
MVRVCRWGILSTAEIGQKNWQAIANCENATVTAVASRNLEKSQAFVDRCMAAKSMGGPTPTAYGSYEELLGDDQVDAVYIPLPTGLRLRFTHKFSFF